MTRFLFLFLFLLSGCAAAVPASFVASERAEYNALRPLLAKEAADHPEDAPVISDNLQSWDEKLKAAEAVK